MSQTTERIHELVDKLNRYRHEYYNEEAPSVSDSVYDHLYDELGRLEKETGIILSNSPTQTVGYKAVSSLEKVRHHIPLLSLAKIRMAGELASFVKDHAALLMLKLDGLTVKLVYDDGNLVEGSTRGDGDEGELITHNIAAFRNVPLSIPYKGRLELSGEGFIHKSDFERLKDTLTGSDGKPYRNARNLASGSIRCLDAGICREREISFFAFNILGGMEEFEDIRDSRNSLLLSLTEYGFGICPFLPVSAGTSTEDIEQKILELQELAEISDIPIDGMVMRYDSLSYSAGLGKTGHHFWQQKRNGPRRFPFHTACGDPQICSCPRQSRASAETKKVPKDCHAHAWYPLTLLTILNSVCPGSPRKEPEPAGCPGGCGHIGYVLPVPVPRIQVSHKNQLRVYINTISCIMST